MNADLTVEIGHTYAPERLIHLSSSAGGDFYSSYIDRYFDDTPEAARLRNLADYFGTFATRVALLDEVIARQSQRKSEDSWRWQHFINASAESVILGTGISRENLFYESDFEQAGRDLVTEISSGPLPSGHRLSKDGRKLIVGSGNDRFSVPLRGFKDHDDLSYPSCQVLDVTWLLKRLTMAPSTVTVIPRSYTEQQRGVQILAGLVGINPNSYSTLFLPG